ncbi:MAG TPA: hypothetical protein VMH22_13820 [bacterium]|nr:hypothetical protein [bacterium]
MTLTGAASGISPAARLKSSYELALNAERLTEAIVDNHPRDIYRMFTPAFAAENSFASFESAFVRWTAGRRIVRASHKVVDVKGPAGYVSSWFVFQGQRDCNYVYQNWLYTDNGWELVWLSRVMDTSFAYGQTDSLELIRVAEAGVRYVLSRPGLDRFRAGFKRPDTVVMVRLGLPGEGEFHLDSLPIFWTTVAEIRQGSHLPGTQFLLSLALVRLMGDMALVTVDLTPTGYAVLGRKHHPRGIEVYLERAGADWRFYGVGKTW